MTEIWDLNRMQSVGAWMSRGNNLPRGSHLDATNSVFDKGASEAPASEDNSLKTDDRMVFLTVLQKR